MTTTPTTDQITAAIRKWGNRSTTSLVASILRDTYPGIKTAWVRKQLLAMEAEGHVKRVPTVYKMQYCWSAL